MHLLVKSTLFEVLLWKFGFADFQHDLDVTHHVLSKRLKRLVEHGVLVKMPYQDCPQRFLVPFVWKKTSALSPSIVNYCKLISTMDESRYSTDGAFSTLCSSPCIKISVDLSRL